MKDQTNLLPPLSLSSSDPVGENAFSSDVLDREELAVRLTSYLTRLRDGAVLAIDAPWGEGKTWFGRNWAAYLKDKEYKVIFIDAFKQDYVEDPFVLIAAELTEAFNTDHSAVENFKEKTVGVMKAMLPFTAKAVLNILGRVALGTANIPEELNEAIKSAQEDLTSEASKAIESKLESYAKDKASLEEFKNSLTEFVRSYEKPVVLFVDELDRCRPGFAVRLIERLKHFFDVPNLVFVLLINQCQLQNAIKGLYGVSDAEAKIYLEKFVNFYFQLPSRLSIDGHHTHNHIRAFSAFEFEKYKFEEEKGENKFLDCFPELASAFNLSLRQIEKCVALYSYAQPIDIAGRGFLIYLIVLKVTDSDIFRRLLARDMSAHKDAIRIIDDILSKPEVKADNWSLLSCASQIHAGYLSNGADLEPCAAAFQNNVRASTGAYAVFKNFVNLFAAKIDLPIQ